MVEFWSDLFSVCFNFHPTSWPSVINIYLWIIESRPTIVDEMLQ